MLKARQDKLNGIVNGIDMTEWDPANDPDTAAPYSAKDISGWACLLNISDPVYLQVRLGVLLQHHV